MNSKFVVSRAGVVHPIDPANPALTRCGSSTENLFDAVDGATYESHQGRRGFCRKCSGPEFAGTIALIDQYNAAAKEYRDREKDDREKRRAEFVASQERNARRMEIATNILDRIETLIGATGEIVFERSKIDPRETTGSVTVDGEKFQIQVRL
jgi:hypothetical protein